MKKLLFLTPLLFLLLAPSVSAKDNFWKGLLGIHGRGGCINASWHAMKDDDHHLVYPDCIEENENENEDDENDDDENSPSASPTATATATATGTATATATASPTGAPTGTATATPTETATATPTETSIALSSESNTGLQGLIQQLIDLIKNLIED